MAIHVHGIDKLYWKTEEKVEEELDEIKITLGILLGKMSPNSGFDFVWDSRRAFLFSEILHFSEKHRDRIKVVI